MFNLIVSLALVVAVKRTVTHLKCPSAINTRMRRTTGTETAIAADTTPAVVAMMMMMMKIRTGNTVAAPKEVATETEVGQVMMRRRTSHISGAVSAPEVGVMDATTATKIEIGIETGIAIETAIAIKTAIEPEIGTAESGVNMPAEGSNAPPIIGTTAEKGALAIQDVAGRVRVPATTAVVAVPTKTDLKSARLLLTLMRLLQLALPRINHPYRPIYQTSINS